MNGLRSMWLLVLLPLASCQAVRAIPQAAQVPQSAVVQAANFDPAPRPPPDGAGDEPSVPPADLPAPRPLTPAAVEPTELPPATVPIALSLLDANALTLAQNPDLITARQAEGVSMGALGVAQTYPFNPIVQLQVTPDPRLHNGATGSTAHYVLLMQTLQLAHQRQYREEAAGSALNGVRWNIVQAELQAVAATQRLFYVALYQRGLRDLAQANADLNRELLSISEKQLARGQLSKSDVAIVHLDEAATRRRARLAEANYQTALLDLRRQLNLPIAQPLDVRGNLADLQLAPSVAQVVTARMGADMVNQNVGEPSETPVLLASSRPDVLAAHSELDAARASLGLANANRTPDLQIGPYYQRTDSGATLWGFRAQADLPIVNSGKPLVRQRMAELVQRQTAWEQLHARATREAEAAIDRYERARRLVAESGGAAGNELPADLQRLEGQFKAGEIDIVRIVTARTSFLAARQAHLDSLNELAQAAAALTAATGLAPAELAP